MDFKDIFLKLTEYTIPFGHEQELEYLLPAGFSKDSIGNYYYKIGTSDTLFTSHLDTACEAKEKINHIIDNDIIKTDNKTILGGDNKAGCLVLFYLIEKKIPGMYYFFLGEESTKHKNYPHGSLLAIEEYPERFSKFKRVISFDRKEKGELVTRQLGRNCCSDEFANSLIELYKKNGLNYKKDTTGYYTDSAFFSDIIPEVVNLSIGVYNEHTKDEYVDIKYVEEVAKSSAKINWESLPTKRILNKNYVIDSRKDSTESELNNDQLIFKEIFTILDDLYFVCHEIRSYQNYLFNFKSGREYHFTMWHEDENLTISINNGIICCNDIEFNEISDFKKSIGIEILDIKSFVKILIDNTIDNKISDAKFNYLIYQKFDNKIDILEKYLFQNGYKMTKIGKGYEIKNNIIKTYELFKFLK